MTEAVDVAGARTALAEAPDCVIVDYQLPDGSGEDVLSYARTRPDSPPVIVLTGQGDEDLAVRLMKKGARDYIAKGQLDPARLAKSVRQVVDVTRAERETVRARRAQEFLLEVSSQLAQSLDHEATMQRVAGLPVRFDRGRSVATVGWRPYRSALTFGPSSTPQRRSPSIHGR